MTHYVGLVVAETQAEIDALCAPFGEGMKVTPYEGEVYTDETLASMARHYGCAATPEALLPRMRDWSGAPGVIRDGQLVQMTTYNTASRWDWYVVGGGWSGQVPGEHCLASEVREHFQKYLPKHLVDSDGWHTDERVGWFGTSRPEEGADPAIVAKKLAEHANKTVWVVDFHI